MLSHLPLYLSQKRVKAFFDRNTYTLFFKLKNVKV